MTQVAYSWIIGGAASAWVVAVVCWYFASIYGTSARKGRALLAATLFGGAGISIANLAILLYQRHLPVFEAEGDIEAVSVHPGKYVRSDLLIRTSSGADIALHAYGRSPYFRRDEHVKVRYQGETENIQRVLFLSSNGREEGVFNNTGMWPAFFFLLVGVTIIFYGCRRYRRDPEGAEGPSVPDKHPYGSVDQRSLLNLSEHGNDESEPDYETMN